MCWLDRLADYNADGASDESLDFAARERSDKRIRMAFLMSKKKLTIHGHGAASQKLTVHIC